MKGTKCQQGIYRTHSIRQLQDYYSLIFVCLKEQCKYDLTTMHYTEKQRYFKLNVWNSENNTVITKAKIMTNFFKGQTKNCIESKKCKTFENRAKHVWELRQRDKCE